MSEIPLNFPVEQNTEAILNIPENDREALSILEDKRRGLSKTQLTELLNSIDRGKGDFRRALFTGDQMNDLNTWIEDNPDHPRLQEIGANFNLAIKYPKTIALLTGKEKELFLTNPKLGSMKAREIFKLIEDAGLNKEEQVILSDTYISSSTEKKFNSRDIPEALYDINTDLISSSIITPILKRVLANSNQKEVKDVFSLMPILEKNFDPIVYNVFFDSLSQNSLKSSLDLIDRMSKKSLVVNDTITQMIKDRI